MNYYLGEEAATAAKTAKAVAIMTSPMVLLVGLILAMKLLSRS